jgi:hypothetical protein
VLREESSQPGGFSCSKLFIVVNAPSLVTKMVHCTIEAFLSGAPLCPGGGAAHSQGRSRDHLPRCDMDETG